MEENKNIEELQEKSKQISYEDLKNITQQLAIENEQLKSKMWEMQSQINYMRLQTLLDVVGNADMYNMSFVRKVINEIEDTIYPEADEDTKESNSEEIDEDLNI